MALTHEHLVWHGELRLVVRDSRTGEIKKTLTAPNQKLSVTFPHLGSILFNNPGDFTNRTQNKMGIGSADGLDSADTTLSGETESRTLGRFSQNTNSPAMNLSFSFTNHINTISIGQAAIFFTLTGGNAFVKASFTRLTISSQDALQATWAMSFASAA